MHYYAIIRSNNSLKHYGIKGMKWGVRKALYEKNDKSLERHYRKAAKKLAKLETIGNNPARYAAKSAAYGAAAAGVGTLAVGGTNMLANIVRAAGKNATGIANRIEDWGNKNKTFYVPNPVHGEGVAPIIKKSNYSNLRAYRLGTGLASAGLAGLSGINAYRASHGARYRKKAYEFRNAMNEAFSGTKYAKMNGLPLPPKKRLKKQNKV